MSIKALQRTAKSWALLGGVVSRSAQFFRWASSTINGSTMSRSTHIMREFERPSVLAFTVFVLISTAVIGPAAGEGEVIEQKVLYNISYVNFAWGYSHNGIYIDNEGNVFEYKFTDGDAGWINTRDETYTEEEILANFTRPSIRSRIDKIDRATLLEKYKLIKPASEGEIVRTSGGADMGSFSYTAYLFNSQTKQYKAVILDSFGDWKVENRSPSAKALHQWLRQRLGLNDPNPGLHVLEKIPFPDPQLQILEKYPPPDPQLRVIEK